MILFEMKGYSISLFIFRTFVLQPSLNSSKVLLWYDESNRYEQCETAKKWRPNRRYQYLPPNCLPFIGELDNLESFLFFS